MPMLPMPACIAASSPHAANGLTPSASPGTSRCPASSGGRCGGNLYEAWVRNPFVSELIKSPSISLSAMRSMRLLPHILEPMVQSAWTTSCESFTMEEICLAKSNFFRTLQSIYPAARSCTLVQALKLLFTLPRYWLKAMFSKACWRPYIWSSWWWAASLPLFAPTLQAEAANVNSELSKDPRICNIQPLFRGCHQLVELACFFGVDLTKTASQLLDSGHREEAAAKMIDCTRLLHTMTQFLNILAQLDTCGYQEYRPSLKGTSGGDSINLRLLTRMCRAFQVDGDDLAVEGNDISGRSGGQLLNAVHSLQYGIGLFWSAHLGLAVASNGLDATGTAGTSIRQMFVHLEGVLNTRFSQWVPRYAAACPPNSRWVNIAGTAKEIGEAIYADSGLQEVTAPSPRPLSSQPEKLFDDGWASDFRSQSMAPPLKSCIVDPQQLQLDHIARLDLGHFYSKVLPDLEATVLDLLHLDTSHAVNIGGNLSELMFRILVGVQQHQQRRQQGWPQPARSSDHPVIVSACTDFLSFRAAWKMMERWGWSRTEVLLGDSTDLARPYLDAMAKHGSQVKVVHVTAVTSVSQLVLTETELSAIIGAARKVGAVVLIDVCQAFCNIEYNFARVVKGNLQNVFILGSCVKHARSLEGVGWCAFDPSSQLCDVMPSGWCADLSVLSFPMHDPEMKEARTCLEGGTVANAVHAELFVKQQKYLRDCGLSVAAINQRVRSLQELFLERLSLSREGSAAVGRVVGWMRRLAHPDLQSKVLVLDCSDCAVTANSMASKLEEMGLRLDSRHNKYLRIGFDLCHTEANVTTLADAMLLISEQHSAS
eukprot:gb/GFBE01062784.1/.p1 GENE.gb/GFBE01062784.1/~~gb/GFBE01062784.1/.p1  ORF type:complete len:824 (+),score=186.05 gb/GFBE01062784.1/:1-2472(+)